MMFSIKYRYAVIVLLGIYSYLNTLFTEVYHYYGITAPWYMIMGVMVFITFGIWEANRLILVVLENYRAKWSIWQFLCIFFIAGVIASVLLALGISWAAAQWLHAASSEVKLGARLAMTYGTRINLFLHIINGIFIFNQQYRSKQLEAEELKRINAQAQLQAIKNQVNPHFLFNNLNVLSGMVIRDNPEANTFIEEFSKVYRHILNSQDKELIPIGTELEYIQPYIFLLEKRFPESIAIQIHIDPIYYDWLIVPAALQMLIENAIKHNILSQGKPLHITIAIKEKEKLVVTNNLQLKPPAGDSTQLGLKNIEQRYEMTTGRRIGVTQTIQSFIVELPLIPPAP